jgi:hypothetical protein
MDYGAMYLTAKKTNIKSVSKQSKFEGSDREVRGWIVKQLVAVPLTKGEKGGLNKGLQPLALPLHHIKSEFPHKNIEKIVQGLIDEGIVEMKNGIIRILE